jgi:hypothetical protein
MKSFLLLLFGCLALGAKAQYLTLGVDMHLPLEDQKGRLKNAYGVTVGYEHFLGKSPFYALVDLSGSMYDYKELEQELPGPGAHITHQDVQYTSMVSLFVGGIGIAPLHGKTVSPYLAVKGGYIKHRTAMSIYDADDPDGCRPEERKNILRDFTPVAVAASGFKLKLAPQSCVSYFDFGVNYITGGTSDYLRMRKSSEAPAPNTDPYLVKFEHIPTGEVHAHPLGDVYSTPTRQLQFYIKAVLNLKKSATSPIVSGE